MAFSSKVTLTEFLDRKQVRACATVLLAVPLTALTLYLTHISLACGNCLAASSRRGLAVVLLATVAMALAGLIGIWMRLGNSVAAMSEPRQQTIVRLLALGTMAAAATFFLLAASPGHEGFAACAVVASLVGAVMIAATKPPRPRIGWGDDEVSVSAAVVPRYLWHLASIDVYLGNRCVLRTGGVLKATGETTAEFEHKGKQHSLKLAWGRMRWPHSFPIAVSIDSIQVLESRVPVGGWWASWLLVAVALAVLSWRVRI